jgi:hypothetical protein
VSETADRVSTRAIPFLEKSLALYMSPPGLMTWWTGPVGTGPSDAGHTLEAYSTVIVDPSAPSVQDQSLNVLQSFYNNSLVFQSGDIVYSITA